MDRIGTNPAPSPTRPAPAQRPGDPAPPKDRFVSPDMAQMLEDLQQAEARQRLASVMAQAAPEKAAPAQPEAQPAEPGKDRPEADFEALKHSWEKRATLLTAGTVAVEAGELLAEEAGFLGEAELAVGAAGVPAHGELLSAGVTAGLAVGSALIAVNGLSLGATQIREGLEAKDKPLVIEGVGTTLVGLSGGASAISLAGHGAGGALGTVASGAGALVAPLEFVHGGLEAGLGIYGAVQGAQAKDGQKVTAGLLQTGMGAAVMASALGGGLPAVATAGAFLAAQVIHEAVTGD